MQSYKLKDFNSFILTESISDRVRLLREYDDLVNNNYNPINEGLVSAFVNYNPLSLLSKFISRGVIDAAMGGQIEKAGETNKQVKELMKDLRGKLKDLEQKFKSANDNIKDASSKKENQQLANNLIKSIEDVSDEVSKNTFNVLSVIDKASMQMGSFTASVLGTLTFNWDAIFNPVETVRIIIDSYNYYLAIIKKAFSKDLILFEINFDNYLNAILKGKRIIEQGEQTKRAIEQAKSDMYYAVTNYFKTGEGQKAVKNDKIDKYLDKLKTMMEKQHNKEEAGYVQDLFGYDNPYSHALQELQSEDLESANSEIDGYKQKLDTYGKAGSGQQCVQALATGCRCAAEVAANKVVQHIHHRFMELCTIFKSKNQKNITDMYEESLNQDDMIAKNSMDDAISESNTIEEENDKETEETAKEGEQLINENNEDPLKITKSIENNSNKDNQLKKLNQLLTAINSIKNKGKYDELSPFAVNNYESFKNILEIIKGLKQGNNKKEKDPQKINLNDYGLTNKYEYSPFQIISYLIPLIKDKESPTHNGRDILNGKEIENKLKDLGNVLKNGTLKSKSLNKSLSFNTIAQNYICSTTQNNDISKLMKDIIIISNSILLILKSCEKKKGSIFDLIKNSGAFTDDVIKQALKKTKNK